MAFFGQKYGLTHLKKCDFEELEKFIFLRLKKVFFFFKVIKHYLKSYFDQI